jgi:Cdc6-like AAA superfamily ATPase
MINFNGSQEKHKCATLGPFPQASYIEINHVVPNYKVGSIYQGNLLGREKDTFNLVNKILSNKAHNLFTLYGLPGVGKSALARKALQFIEDRCLLAGG